MAMDESKYFIFAKDKRKRIAVLLRQNLIKNIHGSNRRNGRKF